MTNHIIVPRAALAAVAALVALIALPVTAQSFGPASLAVGSQDGVGAPPSAGLPAIIIGMDAGLTTLSYGGNRITSFVAPLQRVRIEAGLSPQWSVQIPFAFSSTRESAPTLTETSTSVSVGLLPIYYFGTDRSKTRPFLSAGGAFAYDHSASLSEHQFSARAEGGLAVPLIDYLALRPSVFVIRNFSQGALPATTDIGLSLGLNYSLPSGVASSMPQNDSHTAPFGRNELRMGASFDYTSYSSTTTLPVTSSFELAVPSPYIGYFYTPSGSSLSFGGLMSGALLHTTSTNWSVELAPTIEWNVKQPTPSEVGTRIGARYDYGYAHIDGSVGSYTEKGVGAFADLTKLSSGGYVWFAGAGYDRMFSDDQYAAGNSFSLHVGVGKRY